MNSNLSRILNIAGTMVLITGIFSKHMHFPGANAEIVLSTALIITLACIDCIMKKDKFNILMGLSLCVMFAGALFKALHWTGSSTIAGFGVGLSIAITLILSFRRESTRLSQQNNLTVFLLLIYVVTLMQNNPLQHMLESDKKPTNSVDSRIFGVWQLDPSVHISNELSLEMAMLYMALDSGSLEFQKDSVCITTDKNGVKSRSNFYIKADTIFFPQSDKMEKVVISFNDTNKLRLIFSDDKYCYLVKK